MARAKADAERFLKEAAPGRAPRLQLMFETPRLTKAVSAEPAYFIFSDEQGGYVIAAGDDSVPSILGYSTSESFRADEMPENLRAWLDMWSSIVEDARLRGAAPYQQSAAKLSGAGTSKLLETALWDQHYPFNEHCVVMEGQHAVTGCVATATAILMRYYKWPERGKGILPSYTFTYHNVTYTVPGVTLGRPYDWGDMPTSRYDGTWTSAQIEEVSILMRDLGVMQHLEYSPDGTSGSTPEVGSLLVRYMDYFGDYGYDGPARYPDLNEWIALLKTGLDENHPILYHAVSSEGGHAFILDGYDERNYFHVNWGWSGSHNGYYAMPDLNGFTKNHGAFLHLRPNGWNIPDNLHLFHAGLSASTADFAEGSPFKVTCDGVNNCGGSAFAGEVAFAKFDYAGTMEELVSAPVSLSLDCYQDCRVVDVPCVINTPIKFGDVVRMVYRSSQTPSWTPVRYDPDGGIAGAVALTDGLFPEDAVSLSYDATTGILTVSLSEGMSGEFRRGSTVVRSGVSGQGDKISVDANQLAPASYTLHLQYGEQEKDITIKFGLKK